MGAIASELLTVCQVSFSLDSRQLGLQKLGLRKGVGTTCVLRSIALRCVALRERSDRDFGPPVRMV